MWTRLDADLSEKDRLAINVAMAKVAFAGVRVGAAEMAAQVSEDVDEVQLHVHFELDETDTWAERYGDAEEPA